MRIFKVDVPIFQLCIVCCHSCSVDEAENEFYNFCDSESVVSLGSDNWVTGGTATSDGDIYMWVKDPKKRFSDVYHELIHVIDYLCELKGIEKDEELRAYLMGWFKVTIADVIVDHLNEVELSIEDE